MARLDESADDDKLVREIHDPSHHATVAEEGRLPEDDDDVAAVERVYRFDCNRNPSAFNGMSDGTVGSSTCVSSQVSVLTCNR